MEHGWDRPHDGGVDRWVSIAVALAVGATFALGMLGLGAPTGTSMWWVSLGLVLAFGAAVLASVLAPGRRLGVAARLACMLPGCHLVACLLVWIAHGAFGLEIAADPGLAITSVPHIGVLAMVAIAIVAGGRIAARAPHDTRRATASVAILTLLLLGVWVPIGLETFDPRDVPSCICLLVPPWAIACGVTVVARRLPSAPPLVPWWILGAFIAVPPSCCLAHEWRSEYVTFVPWLLSAAVCAAASVIALARHASSPAPVERAERGRIVGAEVIAGFCLHSWLRGPEPFVRGLEVQTSHGIARVPATARLIAPLPLSTTVLRTGEYVPLVSSGDRVKLVGFVPLTSGGPFRDAQTLVAGDHPEVHVLVDESAVDPRDQRRLVAWRPAVAYLVALLTIAPAALCALRDAW